MIVAETDRLILRRFNVDDAPFILNMLNEPSWIRFIGDRGVRDLDGARDYLLTGPIAMYERAGFGLFQVILKEGSVPIGMCGLIRRDNLPDVDVGFSLMPDYWGKGYAGEAAAVALALGLGKFGLKRIVAITSPDNESSIRLLGRLGFKFEKVFDFRPGDPVNLYAIQA
ncbi:MAG: GNAT family N-acetyltransferase [Betaproteobacteria bacterium]